jgi:hypothetical protein
MSKRKFNELNDIIDTAYVVADYSDSNRCYDNTMDRHVIRRDENFGQPRVQSQEPYRVGFSSNNSFRNDGGNIFLKNSQNSFQSSFYNANNASNMNNANNTSSEKSELNKIVLNDDDNFPSLGSNSTKVNKPGSVQNKLDFKKVVEKKPEVVNKTEPKVSTMGHKRSNYSQYSIYQEIREQSERIAKWKMGDDVSSDDNGDDNYY